MSKFLHQKTANDGRQDTDGRLLKINRKSQYVVQLAPRRAQRVIPQAIESVVPDLEPSELRLKRIMIGVKLIVLHEHVLDARVDKSCSDTARHFLRVNCGG